MTNEIAKINNDLTTEDVMIHALQELKKLKEGQELVVLALNETILNAGNYKHYHNVSDEHFSRFDGYRSSSTQKVLACARRQESDRDC